MLAFYLQILAPIALSFIFVKRKKYFWILMPILLVLTCVAAYFIREDWLNDVFGNFGYFIFYILGYSFAGVSVFLLFDISAFPKLYLVTLALLAQNFSHHLFNLIMRIVNVPLTSQYNEVWCLVLLGAIYVCFYSIYFYFFILRLRKRGYDSLPGALTLITTLTFLVVMIFMGVYIRHIKTEMFDNHFFGIFYETYSVLLDLLIIFISLGIFSIARLKIDNDELELRLMLERKYYKTAKRNLEQINIKCHDLKHQINALKSLEDSEIKTQTIKELEKEVSIYENIAKTGNETIDCVITEKALLCHDEGILLTVMADGTQLSFLKHNEIYSLLGNLLDNAIEASLKIEDEEKRIISLKIFEKNNIKTISVINYYDKEVDWLSNGLPKTSKKGRGHGFGTKSVKYIVEKHDGVLSYDYSNNLFSVNIVFLNK